MELGSCAAENNGLLPRYEARNVGVGSYGKLFESGGDRRPSIKKRWVFGRYVLTRCIRYEWSAMIFKSLALRLSTRHQLR
jgi:hypothetical protein